VGRLVLKFAAGEKRYGYTYLFGPNTIYGKVNDTLSLGVGGGVQPSGLSVILYNVKNGNLPLG
jgi:hypothetical protein